MHNDHNNNTLQIIVLDNFDHTFQEGGYLLQKKWSKSFQYSQISSNKFTEFERK